MLCGGRFNAVVRHWLGKTRSRAQVFASRAGTDRQSNWHCTAATGVEQRLRLGDKPGRRRVVVRSCEYRPTNMVTYACHRATNTSWARASEGDGSLRIRPLTWEEPQNRQDDRRKREKNGLGSPGIGSAVAAIVSCLPLETSEPAKTAGTKMSQNKATSADRAWGKPRLAGTRAGLSVTRLARWSTQTMGLSTDRHSGHWLFRPTTRCCRISETR